MKTQGYNRCIITAAIAGILVSTYALYVELVAEARPGYKALCDISKHAQCSRVLTSEYSKGFGLIAKDSLFEVPNCVYGIVFYCIIIILTSYDYEFAVIVQVFLSLCSMGSCIYLAYLLIFVLYDFCVVCVSMYVVNTVITILVFRKLKRLKEKNK